jgi:phage protein D
MTDPSFSSVTPVFTVDGSVVAELARDCLRLEVAEDTQGLKTLQAHFVAAAPGATGAQSRLLHLDGGSFDFGKPLQVSLGPSGGQRIVFEGSVSAIEAEFQDGAPPMVTVFAEDRLMLLRMTRRVRTYTRMSDADIAREIAREHNLQADVDTPGPTYDVVQQAGQSDLAFLRERARLIQAELWCSDRTLHFRTRPNRRATSLNLVQGNDLIAARITADLAHQRSQVVVTGYDVASGDKVDERAGPEVLDAEIQGGRTGARVVERALGARTLVRVREVAQTSEEASAWAKAEMLRRGRRFVCVSGTTKGSPDMVVGSRLRLEQVGRPFDGDGYYVTRLQHTFDLVNGLRTAFDAERATVNEVA